MMQQPRRWSWYLGFGLLACATLILGTIGGFGLHFQADPAPLWIALWGAALVLALVGAFRKGLIAGGVGVLATLAVFSLWWGTIVPTNDRDWPPEVAEMPRVTIDPADPSRITVENVRNFDWITTTDFRPRWETRAYDLDALQSVDLVLTYWAGPSIAHTMVSFGFSDGDHLVFSVGIRPSAGEVYSSIAGFFKTYELIVTAADERDVIRLRTSVQTGNHVHLYRVRMSPEVMRGLFLEYAGFANELTETPRFYRTIFANCTTIVWGLLRQLAPNIPLDYRVVLSGYLPGLLFDRGNLDMRFTLAELVSNGLLPSDIPGTLDGPAFSAALRSGIPPL